MSEKVADKKYKILTERLIEENPEIAKEAGELFIEVKKMWRKLSPFIGEEEAYGRSGLAIDKDLRVRGMGIDFILWFVLLKKVFGKLDKELEWFKKNKEILEMLVKEYLEAEKLR